MKERIALVEAYLKKEGLEGGVRCGGKDYRVVVGLGTNPVHEVQLDHRLFERSYTENDLLARLKTIVENYKRGLAHGAEA